MPANVLKPDKVLYPELSYTVMGVLFSVHNALGQFAREKQYCDKIEIGLREKDISYRRECAIGNSGNIADFIVDNIIILGLIVFFSGWLVKNLLYQFQSSLRRKSTKDIKQTFQVTEITV